MNSLQVEYFLALCKTMNFTETAKILYVSQPAISKQIAALEKEMGLTLFDRTYRSLRLTESGELLRDAFTKMGTIYGDAIDEAKRRNARSKGSLAVGVPRGWIISRLLPPGLMAKMKVDYPEVTYAIQNLPFVDLRKKLLDDSLDIIITYELDEQDNENGSLVSANIKKVGLELFCAASYWSDQEKLKLEDFRNETFFVGPEAEHVRNMEHLTVLCEACGFIPRIIHVPNIESAISSVEAGLGVVVYDNLHKLTTNPLFSSVVLPLEADIYLTWKRKGNNPLLALFINELQLLTS